MIIYIVTVSHIYDDGYRVLSAHRKEQDAIDEVERRKIEARQKQLDRLVLRLH